MITKFMHRAFSCFLIAFLLLPAFSPAQEAMESASGEDSPDPLLTLGILGARDYVEGIGDVVIPLHFSGEGLWFLDARASATDRSEQEYNIGAGYRHLIQDRRSLLGANLFFDHREARSGVSFDQIGLGAEYLSHGIDARVNAYWPLDDKKLANEFETREEAVSSRSSRSIITDWDDPFAIGNSVLQPYEQYSLTRTRTTTTTTTRRFKQYEVAMRGLDAEIGMRLPIEDAQDLLRLKAFAGYYHYYGRHGLDDINGFRGRLEAQLRPAFTVDATVYSDDDLTGGHFTLGAYLSLPFDLPQLAMGRNPFLGASERWEAGRDPADMSYRLVDMVNRDPQVRTGLPEPEEQVEQRVSSSSTRSSTSRKTLASGEEEVLSDVTFVDGDNTGSPDQDGTAENPYEGIQLGVDAANSPVWVFDAANPYEENVAIPGGVQVYGDGTPLNGGKTMGGGTHPVVIGQNPAPTFTILGDNVTVSGFDIRHALTVLPGNGSGQPVPAVSGPIFEGIFGEDVSELDLSHNLMTDGSLRSGIVLLSDGTIPGGSPNLIARILNNTIRHAGDDALWIDGTGGSGIFDIQVSGDYSFNGGSGLSILGTGYDTASVLLNDVQANQNAEDGIYQIDVQAEGPATISLLDVIANNNQSDGINLAARADGDGADAVIGLQNITANNNASRGIDNVDAKAYGVGGDAMILFDTVMADGNSTDGIEDITAYSDAGGARIEFHNVTAINTGGDGIEDLEVYAHGENADAVIILNNVVAKNNNSEGVRRIETYAYGDGGNAIILLENVTANNNRSEGIEDIEAYAYGDNADAIILLQNVMASENFDAGIEDIYAYAYGMGGNVNVDLVNVTVNNNEDAGIEDIYADADDGGAQVRLIDVNAGFNGDEGIEDITAYAYGDNADASILLQNVTANNNYYEGFEDIRAYAYGENGNALIGLSGVEASYNFDYGIDSIQAEANGNGGNAWVWLGNVNVSYNDDEGIDSTRAYAYGDNGHALLEMNNVTAVGNGSYGMDYIEADAHGQNGNAEVRLTDIIASQNDYDGIWRARAQTYGDNGHATVSMNNISANNNFDAGIDYIYAYAYGMGGNAWISLDNISANNNDDEGFYDIEASSDFGGAQISLNNVTANGNSDEGIDDIYAYAGGDNADAVVMLNNVTANNNQYDGIEDIEAYAGGANGNALVMVNNVTAGGNFDDGIAYIDAYADDGAATINLANIIARFNADYGVREVAAQAAGAGADAIINFSDSDLTDNGDGGYDSLSASATGGGTTDINMNNVDY